MRNRGDRCGNLHDRRCCRLRSDRRIHSRQRRCAPQPPRPGRRGNGGWCRPPDRSRLHGGVDGLLRGRQQPEDRRDQDSPRLLSGRRREAVGREVVRHLREVVWGEPDYADIFTSSACNGTGDWTDASLEMRAEGCIKGAQYQNVWMYVIHELEDAIGDCNIGDLSANDGGPHAWDEGWAFYAGSTEGTDGSGEGFMLHQLATKRCENFGTCTADSDGSDITGTSQINADMLELYQEGQVKLLDGDCGGAEAIKDKIVDLMTVPVLQGMLRYFYLADPEGGNGGDKEFGELWSFAAAVLPRIHECDPDVAVTIRANTDITSSDAPVSEGYRVLKEKVESVYSCMGISCSQVGGLVIGDSTTYYDGFEPCSDSDSGASKVLVGVLIGAAVAVVAICLGCFLRRRSKNKKSLEAMESDLNGFGASKTGTSTL